MRTSKNIIKLVPNNNELEIEVELEEWDEKFRRIEETLERIERICNCIWDNKVNKHG